MKFTTDVRMEEVRNHDIFIHRGSVYIKLDGEVSRMSTRNSAGIDSSATVRKVNNMNIDALCLLIISMKDDDI